MTTKLDLILSDISSLSKRQRHELLRRLANMPEFAEDIYDIALYYERRDAPNRSYDEFRKELQAEGLL